MISHFQINFFRQITVSEVLFQLTTMSENVSENKKKIGKELAYFIQIFTAKYS